jgi:hypothetical protein
MMTGSDLCSSTKLWQAQEITSQVIYSEFYEQVQISLRKLSQFFVLISSYFYACFEFSLACSRCACVCVDAALFCGIF